MQLVKKQERSFRVYLENIFHGRKVRTITGDSGNVYFVLKDVCDILGIQNRAGSRFKKLEKEQIFKLYVRELANNFTMVTEPGLYELIFQSRKPEAEAFQVWVARDVLPNIRRYGTYCERAILFKIMP